MWNVFIFIYNITAEEPAQQCFSIQMELFGHSIMPATIFLDNYLNGGAASRSVVSPTAEQQVRGCEKAMCEWAKRDCGDCAIWEFPRWRERFGRVPIGPIRFGGRRGTFPQSQKSARDRRKVENTGRDSGYVFPVRQFAASVLRGDQTLAHKHTNVLTFASENERASVCVPHDARVRP